MIEALRVPQKNVGTFYILKNVPPFLYNQQRS